MRKIRGWMMRFGGLFNKGRKDRELQEELEAHIQLHTEDNLREGMTAEEARRQAMIKFGGMESMKEACREQRGVRWAEDLVQDIRYGLRGIRGDAGSSLFMILIAGLGIGGASVVFSLVNAMVLRPLPFHDPGRLVWIGNGETYRTQVEHYSDLRDLNQSFTDLAGWFAYYGKGDREMVGTGEPERLTSVPVTQNFFAVLGVDPAIGRSFTKEECQGDYFAPPAVMLSHSFWRRRFDSDPNVVGRKLTLDNAPAVVIGVLPASFDFASVFAPGNAIDAFIPWPITGKNKPNGNTMSIIGRLKPGVTVQGAQAELAVLGAQLSSQYPKRNPIQPLIIPLQQEVDGQIRPALAVLMCAVGAVMLIVCANLSHLQLARMGKRQKEMAIRSALGAGRFRLFRQMLTEGVTLACCSAALGFLLAVAGTRELAHLSAFDLPLLSSVRVDGSTFIFTLLVTVVSGVLFGLAPALQIKGNNVREGLQDAGRGSSSGGNNWFRDGLVVSEIALACVLLVGAGLLIQSFLHVLDVNLGFRPERAASLRIDPSFRITSAEQQNSFIDDALHRVRAIPGITAAGITDVLPLRGDRSWQVSGKGQPNDKDHYNEAYVRVVTDGYFGTLGVPLKGGRDFTESDRVNREPVVIVNETFAHALWPGQEAIGQIITQDGGRKIIGVVGDVHHGGPERQSGLEMYLPFRQTADYSSMDLVVRSSLPAASLGDGIRAALRPIDPNLPVTEFQTLQGLVDKVVSPRRFLAILLAGFSSFALLVASLGIYALISYSVNRRTREIGIRMALGAEKWVVQRDVLIKTLRLAVVGVTLGLVASFALTRWIRSMLFGTTTTDPFVFSGVILLLCAVALVAGYVPARRASRIDPMIALRNE